MKWLRSLKPVHIRTDLGFTLAAVALNHHHALSFVCLLYTSGVYDTIRTRTFNNTGDSDVGMIIEITALAKVKNPEMCIRDSC